MEEMPNNGCFRIFLLFIIVASILFFSSCLGYFSSPPIKDEEIIQFFKNKKSEIIKIKDSVLKVGFSIKKGNIRRNVKFFENSLTENEKK